MATCGIHQRLVEEYEDLVGSVFKGQFRGLQQNKDYGTLRSLFEVDKEHQDNQTLLDKLNTIRKWNSKSQAVMWRGFTGSEDYSNDFGWETLIWAPKSCALHESFEDQVMDFEITNVEFFEFNYSSKHDYEVGVNIRVEVFDSFRRLELDYESLENVQFTGRYIGDRCDAAGNWRSVYEVDEDSSFNEELFDKIGTIRNTWNQDGRRVLKAFTDCQDSYDGQEWSLWIWGTQNGQLDFDDEDYDMTFTITSVELGNYGSGKYEYTADIEVCPE